ncbi:MAG: MATE family efflux transporter [Anaerovoracaceae bacterium]
MILENILQTLLGTTDTYFAGQLADEAIAGIGVTSLIMNIFISFFTAVSVGTTAVTARAFGAGDREKVNRTVIHSVVLALVLGLAVGLVCGLFAKPILRISGAEETVLSYALPYYMVVTVPSAVLCLQLVLSACLRAVKDTRTPMYVTGGACCFCTDFKKGSSQKRSTVYNRY